MQNPLKLGFFIQPVHPPSRPYADVSVRIAKRSCSPIDSAIAKPS